MYVTGVFLFMTLSALRKSVMGSSTPEILAKGTTSNTSSASTVSTCVDADISDSGVTVIGIAGGSGSGKTTLAQAIYEAIGDEHITYIAHDNYYKDLTHLSMKERDERNFDHPDALDTALLVEHIKSLKRGENVSIPSYDFATHTRRKNWELLPTRPIVLVEGILIFADTALFNLMDMKIFVDTDDDIRLIRRIERDTTERGRTISGVIEQYMATVRPMHIEFVEPSKRNADIIVPVGLNNVAVDLVVSRLKTVAGTSKLTA
jgi:uridine kinase